MQNHPALVLNADFRPLNLFPLSTMDWQTAIKNVHEGNLSVVAEYDRAVRSPSVEMRLPSVVAVKKYVPIHKRVRSRAPTSSCATASAANTAATTRQH